MIAALTYVPRRNALARCGPAAATAYLLAFAVIAFASSNPILLAGVAAATIVAGWLAGARSALVLSARWGVSLALLVIAVNAIASQRGDTILARGPHLPLLGAVDISAEALVEGAVLALRIVIVIAAFGVHSSVVDPDRLLRLVRPLARRSALTATLMTRLVPLAAADQIRLREAAALRGPGAAPVGRAAMARRLLAGSLDRAVDVAATLELRGYAGNAPGRAGRRDRTPRTAAFALASAATVAVAALARLTGAGDFGAYPTITLASGPATLATALALPLIAAAPFVLHGSHRRSRRRRG